MKTKATRIIDADGHVRETDEEIIEYMSAGYRNRRDAMLYFPLTPHHGWHRSIPANDFRPSDFRVPDWREWVDKLDEGRFELTVLYPTRFMHVGQIGNPTYAVELCRAYNDYLNDRFLIHDRRFRGMALLPMQQPKAAVKELRRVVKRYGMVGGILPADGLQLPLGHKPILAGLRRGRPARLHLGGAFLQLAARQRPLSGAQRSGDVDPCHPADAPIHQHHVFRCDEQTEEAPARLS